MILSRHAYMLLLLVVMIRIIPAQVTPGVLRCASIQAELMSKTMHCDSVILFDRSGFWSDNDTVVGFAFKKGGCYKVTVNFFKTGGSSRELANVKIEREQLFDALKNYISTNFNALKMLDNDSLNIRSRTNTQMAVSDQDDYVILVLFPKRSGCMYMESYAPELYQPVAWTNDRQTLLNAFARLRPHLK